MLLLIITFHRSSALDIDLLIIICIGDGNLIKLSRLRTLVYVLCAFICIHNMEAFPLDLYDFVRYFQKIYTINDPISF